MIYIEPATEALDEALAIRPAAVDDPRQDAAHGLRLWRRLSDALDTDKLWLRTPDMQGVLNTAGLIVQQEALLMAMIEQPDAVHRWLDRACGFLVDLARYERERTAGRVGGNIWPTTFFPADLGISFTEDMMPLLPPELYAEFGIPQLRRLQGEFGGLHIHCCGAYGQHVPALVEADLNIAAIEFHHPHTTLEQVMPLAERGAVLVPYLSAERQDEFDSPIAYWRWLLEHAPPSARFWFAAVDAEPATLTFVREVVGG